MVWQERRSNVRHAVEIPVRFRILSELKQPSKPDPALLQSQRTKNISESGLLFLSKERFKSGTLLELTLPIHGTTFTIVGKVVHSSRDSESGLFRSGINFSKSDSVFKIKMAEQVYQIDQYRKSLSAKEGRVISQEEAAERWITVHSNEFANFYLER